MTERERMLAGEMYDPSDAELTAMRLRARKLTWAFNRTPPDEVSRRREALGELFGCVKGKPNVEPPFHCDYGSNISVGCNFFMNFGGVVLDVCPVVIGDDVMMASGVQLLAATHPVDPRERISGKELGAPITIGDRAWLGAGVIVLPGVTIGADTTIGAGSVVTRDVPDRVVAAGNPCRVIRTLRMEP